MHPIIPYELRFGDVELPHTLGNVWLWKLFAHPNRRFDICDQLGLTASGAKSKIYRAADAVGAISPRLAVELRHHIHFEGRVAFYRPSGRVR